MKNLIIIYATVTVLILSSCQAISVGLQQNKFNYFVRKSLEVDFKTVDKWREAGRDTIIFTKWYKGAYCDIPQHEYMKMKISNDTIIFDFGLANVSSDCERKIGVAGIMVDFVLNKNKFKNYGNLKMKYITR